MNEWSVSEEPCDAFEEVSKHSWGEKWKMKREGRKRKLMNCTFVCSGLKESVWWIRHFRQCTYISSLLRELSWSEWKSCRHSSEQTRTYDTLVMLSGVISKFSGTSSLTVKRCEACWWHLNSTTVVKLFNIPIKSYNSVVDRISI